MASVSACWLHGLACQADQGVGAQRGLGRWLQWQVERQAGGMRLRLRSDPRLRRVGHVALAQQVGQFDALLEAGLQQGLVPDVDHTQCAKRLRTTYRGGAGR